VSHIVNQEFFYSTEALCQQLEIRSEVKKKENK
jgi:hypothetical protein